MYSIKLPTHKNEGWERLNILSEIIFYLQSKAIINSH